MIWKTLLMIPITTYLVLEHFRFVCYLSALPQHNSFCWDFNNVLILRINVFAYRSVSHIRDRTNYRDHVFPHTALSATAILTLAFGIPTTRARPLHPTVTKFSSILIHLKTYWKWELHSVDVLFNFTKFLLLLFYSSFSMIL